MPAMVVNLVRCGMVHYPFRRVTASHHFVRPDAATADGDLLKPTAWATS